MFSFLKNHPFDVEAFFESSTVLTFAFPKEDLLHLIPECLELDVYQDKYAFVAIAMVQTKCLRPKGFPMFLGNDFFLIGYRVFVTYTNSKGKKIKGLYILKSETNKKKMELLGNFFTHYQYSTTDIKQKTVHGLFEISSEKSKFKILLDKQVETVKLPENSPFPDWKTARKYAGPLPFTFTYQKEKKEILIIKGLRQNWKPKPLKVINYQFAFLDQEIFKNAILANAFIIENIPYSWKKGRLEKWIPQIKKKA